MIRPATIQFLGLRPQETEAGIFLPLAEEVLPVRIASALPGVTPLQAISCPTTLRPNQTDGMEGSLRLNGPRAAYLAYAAGSRFLGRSDVLDQEVLDWIRRFCQPLSKDERLVRLPSGEDIVTLIATPSATSLSERE